MNNHNKTYVLYEENHKQLESSWLGNLNIIKMLILLTLIYKFNITIQIFNSKVGTLVCYHIQNLWDIDKRVLRGKSKT